MAVMLAIKFLSFKLFSLVGARHKFHIAGLFFAIYFLHFKMNVYFCNNFVIIM